MKENKKNVMWVMAQAMYGNRTMIQVTEETMDARILGWLNIKLWDPDKEPADRTIIRLPGAEHVVLVYNRYQEEKRIQRYGEKDKPLAYIPETGLKLFSRCIALRMDAEGHFASLEEEDIETVVKYLAP